jgi:hypothetical protein
VVRLVGVPAVENPEAELARADFAMGARRNDGPADPATFLASLPALPDFARKRLASLESTPAIRRKPGIYALVSALERRAFYVPFGTPAIPELFSARLGCKVFQPAYFGVDLAALCLRAGS